MNASDLYGFAVIYPTADLKLTVITAPWWKRLYYGAVDVAIQAGLIALSGFCFGISFYFALKALADLGL